MVKIFDDEKYFLSSDPAHYLSPGVLLTEESRGVQVVPRALIGPRSLIEKQNQLEI